MSPPSRLWSILVVLVGSVFMLAPLAFVVINSFNASAVSQFPPTSWSTKWYREALDNDSFRRGIWLSARVALASAVLTIAAGLAAAHALTRISRRIGAVTLAVVNAPLSMPKIVVGLSGLIGFLTVRSWIPAIEGVLDGPVTLVLLHSAMTLPFAIAILIAALEATDRRLTDAGRDLGATRLATFWTVTVRTIAPSVAVAFVFSFMLSFDELEASLFMASVTGNTLPVEMFLYLETRVDPSLAALSTLLLALTGVLLLLGSRVARVTDQVTGVSTTGSMTGGGDRG